MLLIEKTFNYFKQRFLRKFFYRYGFGSPVSKNIWEAQFKDGKWDYLYADQEALHYKSIAKFYRQYGKGSMLDVGCGQGVLYHYLQQDIHPPEAYLGVDISDTAIMQAKPAFRLPDLSKWTSIIVAWKNSLILLFSMNAFTISKNPLINWLLLSPKT